MNGEQAWNNLFAHWAPMAAAVAGQLAHVLGCPTCQIRFIEARVRAGSVSEGPSSSLLFGSTYTPFDALVMVIFAAAKTTVLDDKNAARAIAAGANAITETHAQCAPPEPAGPR